MKTTPAVSLALALLTGAAALAQPVPELKPGDGVIQGEARPRGEQPVFQQRGEASWFGDEVAGNMGASGERVDPGRLIAAHPTLPFNSRVRVTNLANGRSVVVEVIDRGPSVAGRVIDLSRRAAGMLGMVELGTAPVKVEAHASDQTGERVTRELEALAQR
jgi:peptidoglycan lytic transglycosylase